jgi:predicted RNase H-like HicB family nuclease
MMNIDYTIQILQEREEFIAHAYPLDVTSSGQTVEEAKLALNEAVHLFLVTAADMGTLDDVLEEAGYQFTQNNWISPTWVSFERQAIKVGG